MFAIPWKYVENVEQLTSKVAHVTPKTKVTPFYGTNTT